MDHEVSAGTPVREVAAEIAGRLAAAGVASPEVDARWLLDGVTGIDPYRTPERALPEEHLDALQAAVARRVAREPLQLIVGSTDFRGLQLICRPRVFIPRPETEVVAGVAIAAATARRRRSAREQPSDPVRLVDVCTGSGAIACCLAVEVAGALVIATDRDPAAVRLTEDNLARVREGQAGVPGFAPGSDAEVVRGELLDGLDPALRGHLDVVVANPPYLPASDRTTWEPEVADHDPDAALVGGPDGHEVVDALLHLAVVWLAPGGAVVVEIDERRAAEAVEVARRVGLVDVEVVDDLTGTPRCVVAKRSR